jgi:hypothetical protein
VSTYTQEQLEGLIACPKKITVPPKKQMAAERGSRRNGMELVSTDEKHRFRAFMRINEEFHENFSIGLEYLPAEPGGAVCLIRCNGPHEGVDGSGPGGTGTPNHHFGYHVHRARADNLENGLRAERGAEPTKEYGSYAEALRYFLKTCGVQGAEEYFPVEPSPLLWSGPEGNNGLP